MHGMAFDWGQFGFHLLAGLKRVVPCLDKRHLDFFGLF